MAYTYRDEKGQEIIIYDLEESKELREKYHFPNNEESTSTNKHHEKNNFEENNINDNKTDQKNFNKQSKKGCLGLDLCQVFRHDFLSKPTVFKFISISF